jgi:putative ABC transport system permease protein
VKSEERSVEAVVIGEPRHDGDPRDGQLGGNPMWSKAPLVLRRFPAILVAIVAAAVILAVSSAAGPLFLSSAGSASLADGVARTTPFAAGLSVVVYGPVERDALASRTRLLSERTSEVRELGKPVATVIGSVGTILSQQPVEPSIGLPAVGHQVRIVSRTGALEHVERLRSVPGDGVWVSSTTASVLDLEMGDVVSIRIRDASIEVQVVGVYRTLQYDADFPDDHAEFWNPLSTFIGKNAPTASLPPLFVLGSEETIVELSEKLHDSGQYRWDVPLTRRRMELEEGRATAAGISRIQADLDDGQNLGASFPFSTTSSSLPGIVAATEESVASVRGPVFTISLAGRLVALAVVGAVGTFALGRRRTEFELLAARGVGRLAIGARAGVEALIPIGLGTMAGVALAMFIVRRLGPSDLIDGASVTSAYGTAGVTALVGAVLLAGVSAAALRESDVAGSRLRETVQRAPWIGLALGLAGASLYEIVTRGEEGTTERVDVLLLLFPLLFIASGAGLATRWLMRLLPKLRTLRSERSPALFFASRRLAAASRTALVLVTACAVALGIFLYSGVLVASLRATSEAKAFVFTGSDVAVVLPANPALPEQLPFPSTQVARVTSARVRPGDAAVEIIAVEPETFPGAAFWDSSFSEAPLSEVLGRLRPGEELPVLVAGRERPVQGLDLEGFRIPVRRVGAVRAFPGMQGEGPVLVTSRDALVNALEQAGGTLSRFDRVEELWARGSAEQVLSEMRRAGIPIQRQLTAEEVRSTPSFLSLSWTYDLLQALGVLSGILALVGIVLYLQTRQRSREVAYAIARRMGMTSRSHRRSIALELGGMLLVAFLIAAVLAVAAALLVNPRLDPLSGVPPPPVLRLPLTIVLISLGALLAAAWLGAWRAGRRADHARVAEVMRLGG